jgi:peroxiredoxin
MVLKLIVTALLSLIPIIHLTAAIPVVAERAPDFSLSTPEGKKLRLSELTRSGAVVLVVLRGYPGYQCPYCNRQVQDFIANAPAIADAGARVLLVYPGPPADLSTRAKEFLTGKALPSNIDLVLDPDYKFTALYGLRWNTPAETAYPSTFLIDHNGVVFFSKVVKEHGGRSTAAEVLEALPKRKHA